MTYAALLALYQVRKSRLTIYEIIIVIVLLTMFINARTGTAISSSTYVLVAHQVAEYLLDKDHIRPHIGRDAFLRAIDKQHQGFEKKDLDINAASHTDLLESIRRDTVQSNFSQEDQDNAVQLLVYMYHKRIIGKRVSGYTKSQDFPEQQYRDLQYELESYVKIYSATAQEKHDLYENDRRLFTLCCELSRLYCVGNDSFYEQDMSRESDVYSFVSVRATYTEGGQLILTGLTEVPINLCDVLSLVDLQEPTRDVFRSSPEVGM